MSERQTGQTIPGCTLLSASVSDYSGSDDATPSLEWEVQNQAPDSNTCYADLEVGNWSFGGKAISLDAGETGTDSIVATTFDQGPGTYNWSVSLGGDTISGTVTLAADQQDPSVSITSTSTTNSSITVTVSHNDADTVETSLWDDGDLVESIVEDVSSSGGSLTLEYTGLSPGGYRVETRAFGGTRTDDDSTNVTIDERTLNPSVNITGTSVNGDSIMVDISHSDSDTVETSLWDNGNLIESIVEEVSTSGGSMTLEFSGVGPGQYRVESRAFGGTKTDDDQTNVTVEPETTPPSATIVDLTPEGGGVIPEVDVDMGVPDTGVRNYYLIKDGQVIESWEDAFLPPVIIPEEAGTYTVELEVVNDAGLSDSDTEQFEIQFQPPEVTIESINKDGNVIRPTGTIQKGDGEITQIRWIVFHPDPGEQFEQFGENPEFVIEEPAEYTLTLEATDENELIGTDETNFTITQSDIDEGPSEKPGNGGFGNRAALGLAAAGIGGIALVASGDDGDN